MANEPIQVVPEDNTPEPAAAPAAPEPAKDPYADLPEEYQTAARQVDNAYADMTPEQRLQLWQLAKEREDELRNQQTNPPAQPAAPTPEPKKKAEPASKSEGVSEFEQRVANIEAMMVAEAKRREDEKQAAELKRREDEMNKAIGKGLDDYGVDFDPVRKELRNEFIGSVLEMPAARRPADGRGWQKAFGEFLKTKESRYKDAEKAGKADLLVRKFTESQKMASEAQGGAAPSKSENTITVKDAKDPRKVAEMVKQRLGIS